MAEKDKKSSVHSIELNQSSNQSATSDESLHDAVLNASPMSQQNAPHKNVQFRRKRSSLSESQVVDIDPLLLKSNDGAKLETKAPRPIYRKSKSLYGIRPETHFGPKACLLESKDSTLIIQDPSSQMLTWYQTPQSVMIVTKSTRDDCIDDPLFELATWLSEVKKLKVYVEKSVLDNPLIADQLAYKRIHSSLSTFTEGLDDLSGKIDLIICLGGDGALVYVSTLFQGSVPPVMAFHLGSLGFLSPFEFTDYKERISQVLDGNEVPLILRTRLKCDLMDGSRETISPVKSSIRDVESRRHIMALNEVVVDRGATPYLCQLDLYIEDTLVTVVQGDGLIISTPTGSTGYAAAAGASMVHPSVPAIVIAPICPHSLSFRPIIVPAGVDIKIAVSPNARGAAWVSFDGRNRRTLQKRDVLVIGTSMYPLPSVCRSDPIADWFESLAGCLHWNVRKSQSALAPDTDHKNQNAHRVDSDSMMSVGGVPASVDTDTEDGNRFMSDIESNDSR